MNLINLENRMENAVLKSLRHQVLEIIGVCKDDVLKEKVLDLIIKVRTGPSFEGNIIAENIVMKAMAEKIFKLIQCSTDEGLKIKINFMAKTIINSECPFEYNDLIRQPQSNLDHQV
jgi:hypothetical protein